MELLFRPDSMNLEGGDRFCYLLMIVGSAVVIINQAGRLGSNQKLDCLPLIVFLNWKEY